jgi:hypothetical protein
MKRRNTLMGTLAIVALALGGCAVTNEPDQTRAAIGSGAVDPNGQSPVLVPVDAAVGPQVQLPEDNLPLGSPGLLGPLCRMGTCGPTETCCLSTGDCYESTCRDCCPTGGDWSAPVPAVPAGVDASVPGL